MITSKELMHILKESMGQEAARKRLNFLHHVDKKSKRNSFGCRYIDVVKYSLKRPWSPDAVVFFQDKNRVFFSNAAAKEEIDCVVERVLSDVQKDILHAMLNKVFGTNYLSSYEIRKLMPKRGDLVSDGLEKLVKIGLLNRHRIKSSLPLRVFGKRTRYLDFYTLTKYAKFFEEQKANAVIDEIAENRVLRRLQRMFMRESPFYVESFKDTIRPKSKTRMKQAKGMSFDILLPLKKPYNRKRFIAIDVYTRFPVTNEVMNRFAEKIEKNKDAEGIIFARSDLNPQCKQGYFRDHCLILILEHITVSTQGPIIYRKIREKTGALAKR